MIVEGPFSFWGVVNEDSSFSVLARLVSLDGSGSEVAPGEGSCLQQADVASITCKIFLLGQDKDNTDGIEITPDPTVTVSVSILNTLRTVGWSKDLYGYSFRHDISSLYDMQAGTGNAGSWYAIVFTVTLTSGGVLYLKGKVKTDYVEQS